jgi:hypothetical protein
MVPPLFFPGSVEVVVSKKLRFTARWNVVLGLEKGT